MLQLKTLPATMKIKDPTIKTHATKQIKINIKKKIWGQGLAGPSVHPPGLPLIL